MDREDFEREYLRTTTAPTPKLSREQNLFVATSALEAALNNIQCSLPDYLEWSDRVSMCSRAHMDPYRILACEQAGIDVACTTLAFVFSAQTDRCMDRIRVMSLADYFDRACENFVEKAWAHGGTSFKEQLSGSLPDDRPKVLKQFGCPDPARHAEAFVRATFDRFC